MIALPLPVDTQPATQTPTKTKPAEPARRHSGEFSDHMKDERESTAEVSPKDDSGLAEAAPPDAHEDKPDEAGIEPKQEPDASANGDDGTQQAETEGQLVDLQIEQPENVAEDGFTLEEEDTAVSITAVPVASESKANNPQSDRPINPTAGQSPLESILAPALAKASGPAIRVEIPAAVSNNQANLVTKTVELANQSLTQMSRATQQMQTSDIAFAQASTGTFADLAGPDQTLPLAAARGQEVSLKRSLTTSTAPAFVAQDSLQPDDSEMPSSFVGPARSPSPKGADPATMAFFASAGSSQNQSAIAQPFGSPAVPMIDATQRAADMPVFDPASVEIVAEADLGLSSVSTSARSAGAQASMPFAGPELPRHVASQLAQAMAIATDQAVELTLSPRELGRIVMSMTGSEGSMTLTVVAERPETLDLIRRNLDALASEFGAAGYTDLHLNLGQSGQGSQGGAEDNPPSQSVLKSAVGDTAQSQPIGPVQLDLSGSQGLDIRL